MTYSTTANTDVLLDFRDKGFRVCATTEKAWIERYIPNGPMEKIEEWSIVGMTPFAIRAIVFNKVFLQLKNNRQKAEQTDLMSIAIPT